MSALHPAPRDLPGWYTARAAGQVRDVPGQPPSVTVTPSAASALRRLAVTAGLGAIAVAGILLVGGRDGELPWPAVVAVLAVSVAAAPVLARASRTWGDAMIAEACQGYTTSPSVTARWWGLPAPLGRRIVKDPGLPWDFGGVWHLLEDGTVVRAPDPGADPPGMFPGPDGRWMLWTGAVWVDYRPAGWQDPA